MRRVQMSSRRITLMALAMLLAVGTVATRAHAGVQQERMKQCNVEAKAKNLGGDTRKQFMKGCLSAHDAPKRALNRQQEKMKACNVDAKSKGLQGADRRHFMSMCLKSG